MLLIVDRLRRVLNFRVVLVLSLGILAFAPNESLRCMLRDKKNLRQCTSFENKFEKKFAQQTFDLLEIL